MKRIIAALICLGALASCDTEWKQARQIEKNIIEPSFRSVNYLITDFGAFQGDTSSTTIKAINTAIDVCTTEGGGHVIIPEGKWFCKGSVILKSNVDLHFQDGGELVFSTDEKDFLPCVLTRWEGTDVYNYSPMIYAYQQHDIAITGKGILNGQGKQNFEKWKKVQKPDQRALREMGRSGVPVQERVFGEGHWLRPAMTDIIGCSRVKLEDLTIVDGTFWSYHMIACDGCIFRNLRVDSENLNSDGCDPESCSNVLIEGCWFHTGDDGIAVKSGRDQDGWRQGRACENIIIRNCIFDTFANGICIGSEISGGVRNVFIENCIINNAQQGIYFKSNPDRGGYMENVHVRKIKVEHVGGELIKFEPNYKSEKSQNYPTPFKKFRIQSVNARKVDGIAIDIVGFNDLPIKDVLIYNVNVDSAATESRIRNVQYLNIFNCTVNGHSQDTTIMEGTALPPVRYRVFADDISRGAVPTVAQVKRQIRFISELGYNAMTFYIENVVRPHSHPDFAPREGFFTMKQLDEICAYGRKYGVDIIGGFQSFGHMEKLLSLDAYSSLGATVNMIDACNPEAQAFLSDVIGELCENSSSPFFCTYCDETFDLGKGKSANRVSEVGVAQYYADHINFLREVVSSHGKQLLICGDMILKYPAIMEMIPDDVIILTWNYDSPASFAKWIEPFKNAGKTFWVSPGVHACSRMLPDIRVAEGNRRFIDEGIAAGSEGCMVFTWDESTFHSVKLLNYNIAKFAYNMLGKSSENFDVEYERKRFGAINGATSLYKEMMHLMDIPMFSNLNDRIFYQRFTPLPGEPLVIDSRQLAKADSLICVLEQNMKEVKAKTRSGKDELQAWNNMLRSYRFMVDARLAMKEITPAKCDALIKQVDRLEKDFKGWWLKENQRHSYKEGIQTFEDKKQELRTLKSNLIAGEDLKVLDRQNSYMCFWLTTTVSADETVDIGSQPTPGLVFKSASGEHRWTKTESMNGLGMDYNSFYGNPQVGSQVWSYAVLNAEQDTDLSLLFGYVGSADIFLNGECIFKGEESNTLTPDRFSVDCKLCKGANHLFVRLSKDFPEFGFSIYPQGGSITSRKHKYAVR